MTNAPDFDKYKAILVDWDGTIVDSLTVWLDAYKELFAANEIKIPDEEIVGTVFGDWLFYENFELKDFNIDSFVEGVNQRLSEVEPLPSAISFIRDRARKHKLGLVTSSYRANLESQKVFHTLSGFFEVVVAGDEVERHKPDPEPLRKALAVLGVEAAKAIYIGDTATDIQAGNAIGMDTCLLYSPDGRGMQNLSALLEERPDFVMHGWLS